MRLKRTNLLGVVAEGPVALGEILAGGPVGASAVAQVLVQRLVDFYVEDALERGDISLGETSRVAGVAGGKGLILFGINQTNGRREGQVRKR